MFHVTPDDGISAEINTLIQIMVLVVILNLVTP
jgi:hypothetical protein